MKIIELLNKIANGEEVPRKFTYKGYLWEYDVKNKMWFYYFGESKNHRFDRLFYINQILNDEVEIIEEPQPTKEEIKEYTNNFLEAWTPVKQQFGNLFDELIRIKNDLGLNLEDNIKEEPQEHKIPEKINWKEKESMAGYLTKDKQIEVIAKRTEHLKKSINKIIDYLEVNND